MLGVNERKPKKKKGKSKKNKGKKNKKKKKDSDEEDSEFEEEEEEQDDPEFEALRKKKIPPIEPVVDVSSYDIYVYFSASIWYRPVEFVRVLEILEGPWISKKKLFPDQESPGILMKVLESPGNLTGLQFFFVASIQ